MGKKTGHEPARGVKKALKKVPVPTPARKDARAPEARKGGSFLERRLGLRLSELRHPDRGTSGLRDLGDLQAEADRRGDEFGPGGEEAEEQEVLLSQLAPVREAENTRKKFYAELRKVLAAADVIIEVLDARDPGSCRCEELERQVTSAGKRLVLLLNKIDLVPKQAVEAWMKHLQRSFPAIAFKAAQGVAQRPKHAMTSAGRAPEGLLRSSHSVVGADELMQLLKNYSRTSGGQLKTHISVGIVGYPNTGKSSVINSMKRHAAVEVGGRAGVTKTMQEVQLDAKITLIDSPGVVFAGASDDPAVALRNVVRVEGLADPVGVVEALVKKAPREALLKFYGLSQDFALVSDFLVHVGRARGKLRRGGGLDLASTAKSVISDWTTGKFRYYVLPPAASAAAAAAAEAETAEVVNSLAPALDIDALFGGQGSDPVVLGAPQEADEDDAMDDGNGDAVEVDMDGMAR